MARAAQGSKSYEKRATAKPPSVLKENNFLPCTTDAMTGGSQDRNRQPGTHKVHDSCVGHLPLCGESGLQGAEGNADLQGGQHRPSNTQTE